MSDIDTSAELLDGENGVFLIEGQKVYVAGGDHSGVGNVVYLVLARIKGDPDGMKGLSLFLVAKQKTNHEDKIELNDVAVIDNTDKLGQCGVPLTTVAFGQKNKCVGYLIGSAGKAQHIMFNLMNASRIGVGIGATAIGSAAYYSSLDYSKKRKQGRLPDEKGLDTPQASIFDHSDVKRMLLSQKAMTEGSLSLLLQCAFYLDMVRAGRDEIKEIYRLTLELLTPVAKSYPSEAGLKSVSLAMQVMGGIGYSKDSPIEQYLRDIKGYSIIEGTTGIHALDLLGKKIVMGGGIAFRAFTEEVSKSIKRTKLEVIELAKYGEKLNDVLFRLQNTTMKLSTLAMREKKEVFLMDATLYLELFGLVAVGWQWLLQAIPCQLAVNDGVQNELHESKLHTMKYFYEYELPKTEPLIARLTSLDKLLLNTEEKHLI